MVSATGIAISIKITTGMTVQITSAVVLCENVAGLTPCDLRCRNRETIMTPKTTIPIATHHQKNRDAPPEDHHVDVVGLNAEVSNPPGHVQRPFRVRRTGKAESQQA